MSLNRRGLVLRVNFELYNVNRNKYIKTILVGGEKDGKLVFDVGMGFTHWHWHFPFVFGWYDLSAL